MWLVKTKYCECDILDNKIFSNNIVYWDTDANISNYKGFEFIINPDILTSNTIFLGIYRLNTRKIVKVIGIYKHFYVYIEEIFNKYRIGVIDMSSVNNKFLIDMNNFVYMYTSQGDSIYYNNEYNCTTSFDDEFRDDGINPEMVLDESEIYHVTIPKDKANKKYKILAKYKNYLMFQDESYLYGGGINPIPKKIISRINTDVEKIKIDNTNLNINYIKDK